MSLSSAVLGYDRNDSVLGYNHCDFFT